MTKIKLLFITRLYLPHIGGVEKHTSRVAELLENKYGRKFAVTVVTERYDQNLAKREQINNVDVWRITLPNGKTNKFFIWWWVKRHFWLFFTADIIQIHDVFFWILPLYPLLWLLRKKIYITFHGYEAPGPITWRQKFWHRLAAFCCRGNVCVGNFHAIVYGVKPSVITYGAVDEVKPQVKQRQIAFVGRLEEDTGIMAYLVALSVVLNSQAQRGGFRIHLDVFGDGALRKECEGYVSKNKLDVRFWGFVENATEWFGRYQIIFASQYLSMLEAMSQGCTVISFAGTEIKKVYLSSAKFAEWITITHSAVEIADALLNPKMMNKHGSGWAKKQTWEKLVSEYRELWKV